LPPAIDPFGEMLNSLEREHRSLVDRLDRENKELKGKLNSVINSTWNFSQDGWVSNPHNPDTPGSLHLSMQDPSKRQEQLVWTVDSDFRETKKIEAELKAGTPTTFQPKAVWAHAKDKSKLQMSSKGNWAVASPKLSRRPSLVSDYTSYQSESREGDSWVAEHVILHPTSTRRFVWEILGVLLLFYDLLTVPLGAFSLHAETWIEVMDWVTLIFWTCDIGASFITGFINKHGTVVMVPRKIFRHYVRSRWFLLDLAVVGPDWLVLLIVAGSGGGGGGESNGSETEFTGLLRVFRIFRVMRLLRVQKLRRIMVIIQDRIESEAVFFVTRLIQLVILLLLTGHFIASGWFFVGDLSMSNGENWIQAYHVDTRPVLYRYLTSLHWALANFAPGASAAVYATNSGERVYSVLITVFGMLITCLFTAFTTSALIVLQKSNDEINKQFWLLRQYLRQHNVPKDLKVRILRYLNNKLGARRDSVQESRLDVLLLLSDSLRSELQYVVKFGDLLTHPLIGYMEAVSAVVMHGLVHSVLYLKHPAAVDILFQRASVATSMQYVVGGEMEYSRPGEMDVILKKDDWMCEMSLWVSWACRGNCQALVDSTVVVVDSKAFGEVLQEDGSLLLTACAYAENFANWLSDMDATELTDVLCAGRSSKMIEGFLNSAKKTAREAEEEEEGQESEPYSP